MSLSQAYASAHPGSSSSLLVAVRSMRANFRRTLTERRQRAQAQRELEAYSDRQLQDLGISRADIPAVAAGTHGV